MGRHVTRRVVLLSATPRTCGRYLPAPHRPRPLPYFAPCRWTHEVEAVSRASDRRSGATTTPWSWTSAAVTSRPGAPTCCSTATPVPSAPASDPGGRQARSAVRSSTPTPRTCRSPTAPSTTRSAPTCSSTSPIRSASRRSSPASPGRATSRSPRRRAPRSSTSRATCGGAGSTRTTRSGPTLVLHRQAGALLRRGDQRLHRAGRRTSTSSTRCSTASFEHRVIQFHWTGLGPACAPRGSSTLRSSPRPCAAEATSAAGRPSAAQARHRGAHLAHPARRRRDRQSPVQPGGQARAPRVARSSSSAGSTGLD